MTQADLAAAVGTHEMTVSKWERGVQELRGKNLQKVAEALGVSVETVIGVTESVSRETVMDATMVDDVLDLIEKTAAAERDPAVRRQGGTPASRDLLASLYRVGLRAEWPKDWMEKLDAARARLDTGK